MKEMYEYIKDIGEGTFGKVKLIYNKEKNKYVALKIINVKYIFNETRIHASLKPHPNIIQLYSYYIKNDNAFIFMEYAPNEDLFRLLKKYKRIDELYAKIIFMQLINAVDYCHKNNICHRDIKLENILLNDTIVKLVDFGYACYLDNIKYDKMVGTITYLAPEIIKKEKYDGIKTDIWACGVVLYVLLCGNYPFAYDSEAQVIINILTLNYELPDYLSDDLKDLLKRIFVLDPEKRITIQEIWESKWMNNNFLNIF